MTLRTRYTTGLRCNALLRDDAGLKGLVDAPMSAPSLKSYHLLPSVRGGLLAKLGISVISPIFGPSKPKRLRRHHE
jgi:hypothetical protein